MFCSCNAGGQWIEIISKAERGKRRPILEYIKYIEKTTTRREILLKARCITQNRM